MISRNLISSLTDDELNMLLYIVNNIEKTHQLVIDESVICCYKLDKAKAKILAAKDKVSEAGKPIFESLCNKFLITL